MIKLKVHYWPEKKIDSRFINMISTRVPLPSFSWTFNPVTQLSNHSWWIKIVGCRLFCQTFKTNSPSKLLSQAKSSGFLRHLSSIFSLLRDFSGRFTWIEPLKMKDVVCCFSPSRCSLCPNRWWNQTNCRGIDLQQLPETNSHNLTFNASDSVSLQESFSCPPQVLQDLFSLFSCVLMNSVSQI